MFSLVLLRNGVVSSQALVLVHIGSKLPVYLIDALSQARLFNPNLDIFLLAERVALTTFPANDLKIKLIATETIPLTQVHKDFKKQTKLNVRFRDGFWLHASERFLYIYDFMHHKDLCDVFHIENDNLIYCDLTRLLPIFQTYYPGIAAVIDSDNRCIPSFMYFANVKAIKRLAEYFQKNAKMGLNDMMLIAKLKQESSKKIIDSLPIVTEKYCASFGLKTADGTKPRDSKLFYNNFNIFNSLFDGAALGQFIGGIDPRNSSKSIYGPGFINETCVFDPSKIKLIWCKDELGRKVPYIECHNDLYRINNLHIHCKNLAKFRS